MSLGDLHERLLALEGAYAAQGAALAELLRRTAPRCEDSLEAAEARLAGCERVLSQPCPHFHVNYDSCPDCRDWARRLREGAALCWRCTTPHSPERSSQGSSLPDLAEHLAASPEAGIGGAPQGLTLSHWTASRCRSLREDLDRVSVQMERMAEDIERTSATYCAICDGDALPAVRLKGGGFVCEGCVVT